MRRDSRLSVALHVLLHLSEAPGPVTSEFMAPRMKTNPVVFRRTLAGLRDAGIVRSEKGHGGGWSLARTLDAITLADVYAALGVTSPFNIGHRNAKPTCLLEQAANRAIGGALAEVEALFVARMRGITLAEVLADAGRKARRHHRKAVTHA